MNRTKTFGIRYIGDNWSKPFQKLVDGHWPVYTEDMAQVNLDTERREATVLNTTEYDGTYKVKRAFERYENLANNGLLAKVVVIEILKDGSGLKIVSNCEIRDGIQDYFQSINPESKRSII